MGPLNLGRRHLKDSKPQQMTSRPLYIIELAAECKKPEIWWILIKPTPVYEREYFGAVSERDGAESRGIKYAKKDDKKRDNRNSRRARIWNFESKAGGHKRHR